MEFEKSTAMGKKVSAQHLQLIDYSDNQSAKSGGSNSSFMKGIALVGISGEGLKEYFTAPNRAGPSCSLEMGLY